MVRNRFDEQLEKLNDELVNMGSLCEAVIQSASEALIDSDRAIAKRTVAIDNEIDSKEREIENLCLKLLLRQQPVARDLRQISSALKMITDMERIGDQAADIAEITMAADLNIDNGALRITEMAKATIKMVTESVEAFVNKDLAMAQEVIEYDDVVDGLFDNIKSELIEMISLDKSTGNGIAALDILMIAKYFERIGDHATNIAEWVEFSITGVHRRENENK